MWQPASQVGCQILLHLQSPSSCWDTRNTDNTISLHPTSHWDFSRRSCSKHLHFIIPTLPDGLPRLVWIMFLYQSRYDPSWADNDVIITDTGSTTEATFYTNIHTMQLLLPFVYILMFISWVSQLEDWIDVDTDRKCLVVKAVPRCIFGLIILIRTLNDEQVSYHSNDCQPET